jgi:disulfide bond formation protein DsbB
MQRLFFFLLTIVFFIALCHRYQHMMAQRVYGMLIILFSGLGLAASLRQVWLQYVSTGEPADCGASLSYMLTHFPLRDTLMSIFNGSGDCADIVMRIGGFSMAQWSTFFFILFFIAGLYFIMKRNT